MAKARNINEALALLIQEQLEEDTEVLTEFGEGRARSEIASYIRGIVSDIKGGDFDEDVMRLLLRFSGIDFEEVKAYVDLDGLERKSLKLAGKIAG